MIYTYDCIYLYMYIYIVIYIYAYIHMYIYLSTYLASYLSIQLSIYVAIYLASQLSIYLASQLSIYTSIHLSTQYTSRASIQHTQTYFPQGTYARTGNHLSSQRTTSIAVKLAFWTSMALKGCSATQLHGVNGHVEMSCSCDLHSEPNTTTGPLRKLL